MKIFLCIAYTNWIACVQTCRHSYNSYSIHSTLYVEMYIGIYTYGCFIHFGNRAHSHLWSLYIFINEAPGENGCIWPAIKNNIMWISVLSSKWYPAITSDIFYILIKNIIYKEKLNTLTRIASWHVDTFTYDWGQVEHIHYSTLELHTTPCQAGMSFITKNLFTRWKKI